ncbi:MAG: mucoidy inhibitor MuiA family protein [Rhizobiales bacterium]|nr:mucoidy inhibitor MuiA family protein [Hyphomicrobiales bacterium]
MRILAAAFLLSTAFVAPSFAAEIAAPSHVDAVTVYPQGAEVQRLAELSLEPGEHTLLFAGLPGEMQAETIRVEGSSPGRIEIGSVDSKLVSVPSTGIDEQRKRIEKDIELLGDERAALDQAIADAEFQKRLLEQLAAGAIAPTPKEGDVRTTNAAQLGGVLDLVSGKLQVIGKTILDAHVRQREIDRQVNDLTLEIGGLAPREVTSMLVSVHVTVPAATSGTFKLRYRVNNAGWAPIYDARLASPAKGEAGAKIELVRRAEVQQATTESWDNVALTLSTARPAGATAAPDLIPQGVNALDEGRARNYSVDGRIKLQAGSPFDDEGLASGLPAPRSVEQMEAEVRVAGFQALYGIQGRVSIDNTGTAKKVRIATDTIGAKLSARAVPKLDPNAYMTAAFTITGETPLLPGPVTLYRDGVFMGQGYLPMLSPGEETKLGFGVDDLVKVKRAEVTRIKGEEGLITTSNVDTRAYDITVKNLHDFPLDVTVIDQMPFSTNEDVTVATLSGMTPPTQANLERRRGVLAWNFELAPKAEKLIKHGYKITWPKDMTVGQTMN